MEKVDDLPNDIDALKAIVLASRVDIAARDARLVERDSIIERKEDCIQRLEKLVADFKRALFGVRSEKVDPGQFELALEDIETALLVIACNHLPAMDGGHSCRG